ncbi:pumilio/PUF RNA binding protein 3 [Angomonas deanei]|nr:pumilio/PUF RNA binding protein 3 [Angomonas deanei]|eukprot:EPY18198.1 pumilio/PUF RNA binding protein 3 [Angomonas deanei]
MESTPSRHDHNNNNNKVVTPSEVVELKELLLRSILHVDRQNYNNVNNPFENYKLFVTLNLGPIQFRDNHCDIVTLLLSYCKNQKGCRTLQTIMEEEYSAGGATNEVENSWIIQALLSALQHNYTHASSGAPTGISSFSEVMADSYGNFIIQKMFLLFNKKMRRFILTETNLKFNLFNNISNSRHGTFAVQKLIETIPNKDSGRDAESNTRLTEEEENIIADIFNQYTNVKELLINEYGVHVVYKFLSYINTRYAEGNHPNSSAVIFRKVSFIYFTIIKNKNIICNTKNGCCAVQKVIKYFFNFFYEGGKGGEEGSNFFVQFVSGIIFNDDQNNAGTNNYTLCSNAFGNYVIGLILEISFTNQGPLATVLQQFSANLFHDHFHTPQKNNPLLLSLCKNKFSSNVLEKVLEYSEEGTMRKYTEFLLFPSTTALGGHPVNLTEIVTDSIGNYVIQTYLRYVPSPLLTTPFHPTGLTVLQCLKDAIPLLEHRKFGEKMKSQIKLAEMKANE